VRYLGEAIPLRDLSKADGNRTNYSETITVLVGETEESAVVHKDVICRKSDFFVAACSRRWAEGREKTVRLPLVTPEVFNQYLDRV